MKRHFQVIALAITRQSTMGRPWCPITPATCAIIHEEELMTLLASNQQ